MPHMDKKRLIAIVDAEFESAQGDSGGEVGEERARAWRY